MEASKKGPNQPSSHRSNEQTHLATEKGREEMLY